MNTHADNITASMENSRNSLRRIARHDDTEFSNHSILNALEKFEKSVSIMDETILVPCRLMDLKVGDEQDPTTKTKHTQKNKSTVNNILNQADLFDLYNMLNNIKGDLLWGLGHNPDSDDGEATEQVKKSVGVTATTTTTTTTTSSSKGHVRRPSTVSVSSNSSNSSASSISDSDSEIGNENDSGIEEPVQEADKTTEKVAQNFRRHLHGLTRSLRQLTEAAQYLTTRYQHDIGSPSI